MYIHLIRIQEIEKSKRRSIFSFILYILLISPILAEIYGLHVISGFPFFLFGAQFIGILLLGYSCGYYSIKFYLRRAEFAIPFDIISPIILSLQFILLAILMWLALLFSSVPSGPVLCTFIAVLPIILGIIISYEANIRRLHYKKNQGNDDYYGELIEEELRNLELKKK